MSKYTTTIKVLKDNNFNFGLDSYPIFDENYRETLNNNILNHYLMNEIGFETAELFKFYLNQKMNEIMPYYNILYSKQHTLIENFDANVNLTETFNRDNKTDTNTSSTSQSTSNGNSKSKNLYQDTPQGEIKNADIENYEYATNITLDKNETSNKINDTSSSDGTANTTENYIKTIIGNNGKLYGFEIISAIKDNLMNIDLMVINELNELFMGIY